MPKQLPDTDRSGIDVTSIPCAPVIIFQRALEDMKVTAGRLAKTLDEQLEANTTKVLVIGGNIENAGLGLRAFGRVCLAHDGAVRNALKGKTVRRQGNSGMACQCRVRDGRRGMRTGQKTCGCVAIDSRMFATI